MHDKASDSDEQPEAADKRGSALDVAEGAIKAVAPGLAELLVPGSGIPVGGSIGGFSALLSRYARKRTESLIEELRERIAGLEQEGKLNRERLERLDELGAFQAVYANAFAVPEKTELYADLLAGVVSTETPDQIDVESFLATIQSLSVEEINLARRIYDMWESDENAVPSTGVRPPYEGEDSAYYLKRLEGAGLIDPRMRTGPPFAGVSSEYVDPTPTLLRLVTLLRSGRPQSDD